MSVLRYNNGKTIVYLNWNDSGTRLDDFSRTFIQRVQNSHLAEVGTSQLEKSLDVPQDVQGQPSGRHPQVAQHDQSEPLRHVQGGGQVGPA